MSTASVTEEPRTPVRPRWKPDVASWSSERRNLWLLAAVAVCFGLYVLLRMGLRYPYTTDEAIYLSQVNPQVPDYGWVAWRAWGPALLAGPVAVFDAPLEIIRLYFVILGSLGLFLAFRPWLASAVAPLAPVAAALFGSTAVAVFNGSLALPNYYSSLAAIATTGYFVACRRGADNYRRNLVGLAVSVAFAALVRPSDSLWLVLPLGLAWLGLAAWRRIATFGAIAVGQIVGWAPWIIESLFRFGGPFERLHLSSGSLGGTHLYLDFAMVRLYVRLWSTGNPAAVALNVPQEFRGGSATLAEVRIAPITTVAVLWWIALACVLVAGVLGAVLLFRRSAEDRRPVVLIPLVVGLSVAFPYLFMMRYGQLRFLLPAIGLLALPVAAGLLQLGRLRVSPLRALGPGLAVAVALGLIGVQVAAAGTYRTSVSNSDALYSSLIDQLRKSGVSGSCGIAGDGSYNVAYQTRCNHLGRINRAASVEPESLASARGRGESVAVALRRAPQPGSFLDQWRLITVEHRTPGRPPAWFVYLPPA